MGTFFEASVRRLEYEKLEMWISSGGNVEEFAYLAGWCLMFVFFLVVVCFSINIPNQILFQSFSMYFCFQSGQINMNEDFILFTHGSGWARVEGRWVIFWKVFKRLG